MGLKKKIATAVVAKNLEGIDLQKPIAQLSEKEQRILRHPKKMRLKRKKNRTNGRKKK